MKIKSKHIIGMIFGVALIAVSIFFYGTEWFLLAMGSGIILGVAPFIYDLVRESIVEGEKEEMFLEFIRNLAESVKTGTPISKSIVNVRKKPYGVLGIHVEKLANQILMGIPLNAALSTFSKDVDDENISRALKLIGQAEKAGGDIGEILESVTNAVTLSDKLKKERKSAISAMVVQGYIIFMIFIAIVLVMQFKIFPMISGMSVTGNSSFDTSAIGESFIYLLIVQGFFSGLTIGKLSEGSFKKGIKHSFTLAITAFLISTIANVLLG